MINIEAINLAKARFVQSTTTPVNITGDRLNVREYLDKYGVEVVRVKTIGTSALYCLKECIFDPSHVTNDASIGQTDEGKLFYQCFHNSCQGRTWKEAKERISGTDKLTPDKVIENQAQVNPMHYLKKGSELQQMDVNIEWIIADLIPEKAIVALIGPAGYGKSTVCLNFGNAVVEGVPWLGRDTKQMLVIYDDFENPEAIMIERTRQLNIKNVYFWHTSFEVPPPRIDSPEWEMYKKLTPGLLIVDGHRASQ